MVLISWLTHGPADQLIPEDIRILSEYSWDMTGYTSRFGFFYLSNEKADVEGLTRWQAEHIFQLTPTPLGNGVCIYTSQNELIPTVEPPARSDMLPPQETVFLCLLWG